MIAAAFIDNKRDITVLYSHGNSCDIGRVYKYAKYIGNKLKVNVLIYDYIGYGESTGDPSEKNTYDSIEMAYRWLRNQNIPSNNIILWGYSLGSAPTLHHAVSGRQFYGVIIESGLLSCHSLANEMVNNCCLNCIVSCAPGNMYNNKKNIKKILAPLYVIHGKRDLTIDWHQGKKYQRKRINLPKYPLGFQMETIII